MAEDTRAQAEAALKEVEAITAKLLPEPKGELIVVDAADPGLKAEIDKRKAEIDMENTQSIIRFGSGAQAELQAISQEMLAGVQNKDVGPAGESLRETDARGGLPFARRSGRDRRDEDELRLGVSLRPRQDRRLDLRDGVPVRL